MNDAGLPLFSVSYDCEHGIRCLDISNDILDDPELFTSFISAIFSVGEKLGGIPRNLMLEKVNIHAYVSADITGIIITPPTRDPTQVAENENRVRLMTELFVENYRDVLHLTIVNTKIFNKFQTVLEEAGVVSASSNYKKNCLECVHDKACPYRILIGNPNLSLKERFKKIPRLNLWKKMKQMISSSSVLE